MSGAVLPLAAHPLGRVAGVPRSLCPGGGWCGRGNPASAPQRAPLRAGVARCGGGGRASPGGVRSSVVSGVRGPPLPVPRLPALWAGCRGPLPMGCGRGCAGVEAQHCPFRLHALWGLRAAGVVGGHPWVGWPATVVRGVWCQAPSVPRRAVLWGGQPGLRDPCVLGAVGVGVGTQHPPHRVHPCEPALRAVGMVGGRPPGGGACCRCEGRLRSGAPPPSTAHPPGGLSWSATYVLWARVCGDGGPALSPWLACPVGAAYRGGGGGCPRGGWPATIVRGVWCQALSIPRPPILWGGPPGFCGPCVPGAVGAGVGTQHPPHSVRACGPAVGVAEGRPRGGCLSLL